MINNEKFVVRNLQNLGYIITKPVLCDYDNKYLPNLLAFKNNLKYMISFSS